MKFRATWTVAWRDVFSRPLKVSETVNRVIKDQVHQDNKTTVTELQKILVKKGFNFLLRTVLRCRVTLSWTYYGNSYLLPADPQVQQG